MEISKFNINDLEDGDIVIVKGLSKEEFANLKALSDYISANFNKSIMFVAMPPQTEVEIIKLFKPSL